MEDKMIKFMKQNKFMHNVNLAEYKNTKAKERKWHELSNILGAPVNVIKRKWKTLKDGFVRRDQTLTHDGTIDTSKWKHYDDLTFLRESRKRIYLNSIINVKQFEIEERIIEFMKANTFMHNVNCDGYKNIKTKRKKWLKLANELGVDVPELKSKWKSLKESFYREDQKINEYSDNLTCHTSKWKYYNDLLFLRDSRRANNSYTNVKSQGDEEIFNEIIEEKHEIDPIADYIELSNDNAYLEDSLPESSCTEEYIESPEHKPKRRLIDKKIQYQNPPYLMEMYNTNRQNSAIGSFFESMATTLENANLPIEETLHIKSEVLTVITNRITAYKKSC